MKSGWLSIIALFGGFTAQFANATSLTYDIAVTSSHWTTVETPSFGLSGNPTVYGQITVDNEATGLAAFESFWLMSGAHTWTLSEFVGPTAIALFDKNGILDQFSLNGFVYGNTSMY